jgi:hypothetical protein
MLLRAGNYPWDIGLGESWYVHTHVYIHRYLPDRARALSDRQQSNEALFSPLLGCAF